VVTDRGHFNTRPAISVGIAICDYYRLVPFIVTAASFVPSGPAMDALPTGGLLRERANKLPPDTSSIACSAEQAVTALM
jgi:hypothetical protein